MRKALVATVKESVNKTRDEIRSSTDSPYATGTLRSKTRSSVTVKGAAIYNRLPQAAVWNWGGKIKPKGVDIQIPRTEFVSGPIEKRRDEMGKELSGLLAGIADRYGFRPGP
jgi:hypothetical protein